MLAADLAVPALLGLQYRHGQSIVKAVVSRFGGAALEALFRLETNPDGIDARSLKHSGGIRGVVQDANQQIHVVGKRPVMELCPLGGHVQGLFRVIRATVEHGQAHLITMAITAHPRMNSRKTTSQRVVFLISDCRNFSSHLGAATAQMRLAAPVSVIDRHSSKAIASAAATDSPPFLRIAGLRKARMHPPQPNTPSGNTKSDATPVTMCVPIPRESTTDRKRICLSQMLGGVWGSGFGGFSAGSRERHLITVRSSRRRAIPRSARSCAQGSRIIRQQSEQKMLGADLAVPALLGLQYGHGQNIVKAVVSRFFGAVMKDLFRLETDPDRIDARGLKHSGGIRGVGEDADQEIHVVGKPAVLQLCPLGGHLQGLFRVIRATV